MIENNIPSANFKFNSGRGALVCSECGRILKVGYEFSKIEWKAYKGEIYLKPQYCKEHSPKAKGSKT